MAIRFNCALIVRLRVARGESPGSHCAGGQASETMRALAPDISERALTAIGFREPKRGGEAACRGTDVTAGEPGRRTAIVLKEKM